MHAKINELKLSVIKYKKDRTLPKFPEGDPDGSLYGIAFIYDHDKDNRILIAIDKLKKGYGSKDIVAVSEHEGNINIYSRTILYIKEEDVEIFNDQWQSCIFVPYKGKWVEIDDSFIKKCVDYTIGYDKTKVAWIDEPPTLKQLKYLDYLGYTGDAPDTKGAAVALISEYKN